MTTAARAELDELLRPLIRQIPNFPKAGIDFKDITPLLADAKAFRRATEAMAAAYANDGITHVVGVESRGFILAAPIAQQLGAGFIPMRKPGKLPHAVERIDYKLEYGTDALEMHRDTLQWGHRVLIVDDVLATGGTLKAACDLIMLTGSELIGCSVLIALADLPGLTVMRHHRVHSLLRY
ncbi:MAG: adenine phosphoribosyltransferase [Gemmatimonadaceae bacterium]